MNSFAYAAAPTLNIVFFAETQVLPPAEELEALCDSADLIVALGNTDLAAIAAVLKPEKPALCVYGTADPERRPPPPFKALQAGGVTFKDWRVCALSGGKRIGNGSGYFIDDDEADVWLKDTPSCDLLLTHAPPAGLPGRGLGIDRGIDAITKYILEKEPIYHFYAHPGEDHIDHVIGQTWSVGVAGILYPEPLQFV